MNDGDTFTLTFTKAGTYPYACAVHPQMIGQVVVTA
jgi:plastocyanin